MSIMALPGWQRLIIACMDFFVSFFQGGNLG
jgi:hypothetical protein